MFKTGVRTRINASHALRGDFGVESEPHTHPYLLEWTVWMSTLDDNGFAADIAAMEHSASELAEELEGTFLNDLPYFRERQTSLENLAAFMHERLAESLEHLPERMEVTIWESDTAFAAYSS